MSAFPPPPPPPAQPQAGTPPTPPLPQTPYGAVPPAGYDPRAWKAQAKAQERMMRAQLRLQREQLRAQARAARRYSVVGPLFLTLAGVVFLLIESGRLSWQHALLWYGHWWPLLLIGAGLLTLAEWALNGRRGSMLGGGLVTLLVFLGLFGWGVNAANHHMGHMGWPDDEGNYGWTLFGDTHEEDGAPVSAAVVPTGLLQVHNPRGDVSVTGASDDGQVHVLVHTVIHSASESELSNDRKALQPYFSGPAEALTLTVGQAVGCHANIEVTVPRGVTLAVDAGRGAVSVAEMHAPVTVSASRGEVNLSGINGAVTAHMRESGATLSAHGVSGGLAIDGRGGDMNLTDIVGPVSLQGRFSGTTHMEHVNGAVSFSTYRTQFQAARVDGQVEISSGDSDAPLQGEAILGPVTLRTRDRVITLDRVQGNVDITNSNGEVNVSTAGPLGTVAVNNRNASVTLGVPAGATFSVNAQTHDGHIQNEFGLSGSGDEDHPSLAGTVGRGGPAISLSTTDGDVTLRKSVGEALPASLPVTPVLTQSPNATQASTLR